MAFQQYEEADRTRRIVTCALNVHSVLGPGLLESAYKACLVRELELSGMRTREEVPIPILFKGMQLDSAYKADLIVDDRVLLELKAVERLLPIHTAQTLTYLKLSRLRVALLINFNVPHLKTGIQRLVH